MMAPSALQMPRGCCAGRLQADAIASLAELHCDVGEELAGLAAEHGQLGARLAEAGAAERKLDALARLQQRLADFGVLLSSGTLSGLTSSGNMCTMSCYCLRIVPREHLAHGKP